MTDAVPSPPAVSLIVPVFNSGRILKHLITDAHQVLLRHYTFEILIVCDSPSSESLAVAHKLSREFPQVRCLELEQNVGQHRATYAGIIQSRGDTIVTMDEDYQHDPGHLTELIELSKKHSRISYLIGVVPHQTYARRLASSFLRWTHRKVFKRVYPPLGASSFRAFPADTRSLFDSKQHLHPLIIDAVLSQLKAETTVLRGQILPSQKERSAYSLSGLIRHAIRCYLAFHPKRLASESYAENKSDLPWAGLLMTSGAITLIASTLILMGTTGAIPWWGSGGAALMIYPLWIWCDEVWKAYRACRLMQPFYQLRTKQIENKQCPGATDC